MMRIGKHLWLWSLLLSGLLLANPAQAQGCIGVGCVLREDNPFSLTATIAALILFALANTFKSASEASKENSRQYSQLTLDDAAYFIASDGTRRGAYFESALKTYRLKSSAQVPSLSDMAFAQLVLTSLLRD